ncbi:tail fiber domain-containing protein [Ralstonia insidiosa]|uniref:Tail fiber domain-containing protein n=1 Tax=Ralstonia insidiosa TaxID=190721 RepID=A0A848P3F9_9RALS|nr:tail fiber domain-containing protein [Ralstonia insidiosa]NMV41832.1 tail fiber domain-containing protein [Ralstonia insidiosa]
MIYANHYEPDLPVLAFRQALGKNRPATLEGGKGGGAPDAPNPYVVADASTRANQQTAAYNKALNLNNYSNPFGSQQTVQTGTDPTTGAPLYQTTINANPQLQGTMNGLFGQINQNSGVNSAVLSGLSGLQGQYGGINSQLGALGNTLSGSAAQNAQQQGQDAAYAGSTQYLNPQFSQQEESLKAQLANQGLTPGSEAYNNAMLNFNNQKQQAYSDARNQATLIGSQIGTQNWQNQLAGVNTKAGLFGQMGSNLGQQGALYGQQAGVAQMPYSQLQSLYQMLPGYSGPGQSGANPADIAGAMNNQYQGQLAGYNARTASNNATMGALGSLGAAGILGYALAPAGMF